jgi:parvulin-like peptidyl-prolyl isomerase
LSRPLHWGRVAVFLCVLALLLSGCKKDEVARVNGVPITRTQLTDELEKYFGNQVVQGLVERMVVQQAFDKSGLQLPPQKVEEIIQRLREQAGSQEAFQQMLQERGQSEEDLRTLIERNLKLTAMAQKDVQVTEQALKDYYKENEPRYRLPQRISFSEIALPTKEQATDVHAMAVKPNASFADLAKQYSVSPSQQLGGRRPTMEVESIVPAELRAPLLALKPNQISKPVQAGGGWWILQLHEILPAKMRSFAEARSDVETDYKREKQPIGETELLEKLVSEASVKIVDPKYAQLQRLYAGADLLRSAPGAPGPAGAPPPQGKAGAGQPQAPVREPIAPKGETKAQTK